MIHPSYYELMDKMNEENAKNNVPEITSRYYIVLAASKRARQLIDGAEPKIHITSPKLLSTAVEEFYEGLVYIVNDDAAENQDVLKDETAENTAEAETPEEI